MIKKILKRILPPVFWEVLKKAWYFVSPFYGVHGNFESWKDALDYCSKHHHGAGYGEENILDSVASAIQVVRNGDAEFERDSVLFYEKNYNYQFLSALFLALGGCGENRPVNVVDFGGSLGSSYFQNRSLLNSMKRPPVWNVIEQKQFVDRGKMEVPEINFFYTVDEFVDNGGQCDVLLLSAVLEYLEKPFDSLNSLIDYGWEYVIIERSQYSPYEENRIMVQSVPPSIYNAQYPLWLRSEEEQHQVMSSKGYDRIYDWILPFSIRYKDERGEKVIPYKGFLYKNRSKKLV